MIMESALFISFTVNMSSHKIHFNNVLILTVSLLTTNLLNAH